MFQQLLVINAQASTPNEVKLIMFIVTLHMLQCRNFNVKERKIAKIDVKYNLHYCI